MEVLDSVSLGENAIASNLKIGKLINFCLNFLDK